MPSKKKDTKKLEGKVKLLNYKLEKAQNAVIILQEEVNRLTEALGASQDELILATGGAKKSNTEGWIPRGDGSFVRPSSDDA